MIFNLIIISICLLCILSVAYVYRYISLCAEISAKNKIEFYKLANILIESDDTNFSQREAIFKWADTLGVTRYARYLAIAIAQVYKDEKAGKIPVLDSDVNYSDDMARLFGFWMMAQIHSLPFQSPHTMRMLDYILTAKKSNRSIDVELNKDTFINEMCLAA